MRFGFFSGALKNAHAQCFQLCIWRHLKYALNALIRLEIQAERRLQLGQSSVRLHNVRGQVDAALLGFVSRPFGLLQPQGSLQLDIADLAVSARRLHGEARVDWLAARSGMVTTLLGEYRASLISDPDGRRARIDVQTLSGPLAITGNGEYLSGKELVGSLRLQPPPGDAALPFRPALGLLGRPDAEGAWRLQFNLR